MGVHRQHSQPAVQVRKIAKDRSNRASLNGMLFNNNANERSIDLLIANFVADRDRTSAKWCPELRPEEMTGRTAVSRETAGTMTGTTIATAIGVDDTMIAADLMIGPNVIDSTEDTKRNRPTPGNQENQETHGSGCIVRKEAKETLEIRGTRAGNAIVDIGKFDLQATFFPATRQLVPVPI